MLSEALVLKWPLALSLIPVISSNYFEFSGKYGPYELHQTQATGKASLVYLSSWVLNPTACEDSPTQMILFSVGKYLEKIHFGRQLGVISLCGGN